MDQEQKSDFGTEGLHRHSNLALEKTKTGVQRARNLTQSPLDYYYKRKQITEAQYKAGRRLNADFVYSGMSPSVTMRYQNFMMGGTKQKKGQRFDPANDNQIDAKERFSGAVSGVGRVLSPILIHVCCFEGSAGDWVAMNGRAGRQGKTEGMVTLRIALEHLAMHYELI
ncbi:MAG: DUF6456 domain-containing protein [Alphaproteobacteria bacterium]